MENCPSFSSAREVGLCACEFGVEFRKGAGDGSRGVHENSAAGGVKRAQQHGCVELGILCENLIDGEVQAAYKLWVEHDVRRDFHEFFSTRDLSRVEFTEGSCCGTALVMANGGEDDIHSFLHHAQAGRVKPEITRVRKWRESIRHVLALVFAEPRAADMPPIGDVGKLAEQERAGRRARRSICERKHSSPAWLRGVERVHRASTRSKTDGQADVCRTPRI